MTRKKQRHALTRLLRATGAPMAIATKAAKIAGRVHSLSLYGVGKILGGYSTEAMKKLQALGFGVEGTYGPCCSDESHGQIFEPRGVFYAPRLYLEEVPSPEGRTFRTVYPAGTRVVPTCAGGYYR